MAIKIAGTEVINDNKELVLAKLAEIDSSISVTAVDVFVYDTSKDSDGGAWRKRTQGTSWYNETLNTATRGSRREFPAVAVIVAETNKVTIYDGDDPSLPMWMVFNNGASNLIGNSTISSVSVVNGYMSLGLETGGWGICEIRFAADNGNHRWTTGVLTYLGNIAERNAEKGRSSASGSPDGIVNLYVNDVAMTVLPNAPIDAATGLPVPTIAVATDGGVSVIKDDGAVYDITYTVKNIINSIAFDADNNITFVNGLLGTSYQYAARKYAIPSADIVEGDGASSSTNDIRLFMPKSGITASTDVLQYLGDATAVSRVVRDVAIGNSHSTNGGLTHLAENLATPANGMVAYTTSTYNTGWMNGDIKGAFLSDTDDTDLVGTELVTNGTFDTDTDWTKPTGWSIGGGVASYDGSGVQYNKLYQILSGLVIGKVYAITFTVSGLSGDGSINFGFGNDGGSGFVNPQQTYNSDGTYTRYMTASITNHSVIVQCNNAGQTITVDNISVKLADADRSVNNNGLIVNGTVTRSPVATGADLVAYSGFSASNYLEQQYNSDLDFGTGDFCVMGWVKGATSMSSAGIISRCSSGTTGFQLYKNTTTTTPYAIFRLGSTILNGTTGITDQWNHVVAVRKSGIAYIYKNGALESSVAATADISGSFVTQVGWSTANSLLASLTGISLLRISATAPSAEQIAKIYNDEKVLFQEDAQATLYGASDAVTALAHDQELNLLHVGTSAGRSVFQGLRRVSNTTTAVGTAISASNGLVVEE